MRYSPPDGCSLGSAVQPVTIALRHLALGVDPTAAYWDFDLLDGHGGWRAEGCNITGSVGNTTTIYCTHHKNFAVLMVSDPPPPPTPHHPLVPFSCSLFTLLSPQKSAHPSSVTILYPPSPRGGLLLSVSDAPVFASSHVFRQKPQVCSEVLVLFFRASSDHAGFRSGCCWNGRKTRWRKVQGLDILSESCAFGRTGKLLATHFGFLCDLATRQWKWKGSSKALQPLVSTRLRAQVAH